MIDHSKASRSPPQSGAGQHQEQFKGDNRKEQNDERPKPYQPPFKDELIHDESEPQINALKLEGV